MTNDEANTIISEAKAKGLIIRKRRGIIPRTWRKLGTVYAIRDDRNGGGERIIVDCQWKAVAKLQKYLKGRADDGTYSNTGNA